MLDVYFKGRIAIPYHSCTVKYTLTTSSRLKRIASLALSSCIINMFDQGNSFRIHNIIARTSHSFFTLRVPPPRAFPFRFKRRARRLTRTEGEQCIATERSYVDLPIVGSGGSSVGGELVGWLRGVWPHNHSHNDSLLSVSLSLSFVRSRGSHPLRLSSFSSRSFHRRAFHSFATGVFRLALANRIHGRPC